MKRFARHITRRSRLPVISGTKLCAAQLSAASGFDSVEFFPVERWKDLEHFGPNVLAGSSAELQRLVERMELKTISLPTVDHSIFVQTQLGDRPLTDVFRVVLWQRFGVPVYEVYVDDQGGLLAFECEAQDGWHIHSGAKFQTKNGDLYAAFSNRLRRTGLSRRIESAPCACGRSGLRIVDPGLVLVEDQLLAATA